MNPALGIGQAGSYRVRQAHLAQKTAPFFGVNPLLGKCASFLAQIKIVITISAGRSSFFSQINFTFPLVQETTVDTHNSLFPGVLVQQMHACRPVE